MTSSKNRSNSASRRRSGTRSKSRTPPAQNGGATDQTSASAHDTTNAIHGSRVKGVKESGSTKSNASTDKNDSENTIKGNAKNAHHDPKDDDSTYADSTSTYSVIKPVDTASDADKIEKLEKELDAIKNMMLSSTPGRNSDAAVSVAPNDVGIEDATFGDIMNSMANGELREELFASEESEDGELEGEEEDSTNDTGDDSDTILIDAGLIDDDEDSDDESDDNVDDEEENDDLNGETLLSNDDSGAVRVLDSLIYYEVQDWFNEKTGKPYNRIRLLQEPPRFIIRQHMTGDEIGEDDSMVTIVVNRELAAALSETFTGIRKSFDGEPLDKKREPFSWTRVQKSISDTWKYEPIKVVLAIIIVLILIAAVVYGAIVS